MSAWRAKSNRLERRGGGFDTSVAARIERTTLLTIAGEDRRYDSQRSLSLQWFVARKYIAAVYYG